ncbi:hydroxymethylglutaryl-CoA synthase family protein [Archaeoglobus sp.]
MVGIESMGIYVPKYRLDRKEIFESVGWISRNFLPGERTTANYDEDSITMAVNAAMRCEHDEVDAVFFASATMPYKERQNAEIIATALDLGSDVTTADFTGSTKAVTTALINAVNCVAAGEAKRILVCAADCRIGRPGSYLEMVSGDGAAAVVVGKEKLASIDGYQSISYDFMDTWKIDKDDLARSWEDRWIRDEGYKKFIAEAISKLLENKNVNTSEIAKVAYPCLYPRDFPRIALSLGFSQEQIQDPLITTLGNTGNAHPLIMLAAALEKVENGSKIIVASYGSGSDAVLFTAKENFPLSETTGVSKKMPYRKYLAFRELLPVEKGMRGEEVAPTPVSVLWRNRREILALVGSKCRKCGTPQYPSQRVCVACQSQDLEPYRFADKKGKIFSFTEDYLAFSVNPPAIYGIIDFEGGGRYWFDITDCEQGELKVGMPVGMSFRRRDFDPRRRVYNYFWKAVPEVRG